MRTTRPEEGTVSPTLVKLLADMVEVALQDNGSPVVASTKKEAASKELGS